MLIFFLITFLILIPSNWFLVIFFFHLNLHLYMTFIIEFNPFCWTLSWRQLNSINVMNFRVPGLQQFNGPSWTIAILNRLIVNIENTCWTFKFLFLIVLTRRVTFVAQTLTNLSLISLARVGRSVALFDARWQENDDKRAKNTPGCQQCHQPVTSNRILLAMKIDWQKWRNVWMMLLVHKSI